MKSIILAIFCALSFNVSAFFDFAEVETAVYEQAVIYYGSNVQVSFYEMDEAKGEIFYLATWNESSVDFSYDEGEPIFSEDTTSCEQVLVYIVETKKVLLTTNASCY